MNVSLSDDQFVSSWLFHILTSGKYDILLKIMTVLWGIWLFRNQKVWADKIVTTQVVIKWGMARISDWSQAKNQVKPQLKSVC